MDKFPAFAEAYRSSLALLLSAGAHTSAVSDPLSPGSRFGQEQRGTLELIAYSFELTSPASCLFFSAARPVRLPYCLGSLIWSLNGSDKLDEITYYNPRGHEFSDDGVHLSGAFGKRLFDFHGSVNQIDHVVKQLKEYRSSRRAVALILDPHDNVTRTREYPCAIALQYFIREERLIAITYMRSQSAAMVLPYDVFLFVSFQCILAQQLGVEIGAYYHLCGSFHIYSDEVALARSILRDDLLPIDLYALLGKPIKVAELKEIEQCIRNAAMQRDFDTLARISDSTSNPLAPLQQAVTILLLHAYSFLGMAAKAENLIERLDRSLRVFYQSTI